jgi:hypothetical protein
MGEPVREQYSNTAGFIATLKQDLFNDTGKINYGEDVNVARIASYVIKRQAHLMTFISFPWTMPTSGRREGSLVKEAIAGQIVPWASSSTHSKKKDYGTTRLSL